MTAPLLTYPETIAALSAAMQDPDGWSELSETETPRYGILVYEPSGIRVRVSHGGSYENTTLYFQCHGPETHLVLDDQGQFHEHLRMTEHLFTNLGDSGIQRGLYLEDFQRMLYLYFTEAGQKYRDAVRQVLSLYMLEHRPTTQGTVWAIQNGYFVVQNEHGREDNIQDRRVATLLRTMVLVNVYRNPFSIQWNRDFVFEIGASAHARAEIFRAKTSALYEPLSAPTDPYQR